MTVSRILHSFLGLLTALTASSTLQADSTINASNNQAWAGNAAWLNLRADGSNGVVVGEFVISGYAFGSNTGWTNLGSGVPVNGVNYQNDSALDFGVNHDGHGNLSGYAYGANIGWINFGWASANDVNRPRFDLTTGQFYGFAYCANIGWLNLGSGYLATNEMRSTDNDIGGGDGIADEWEILHFGNLTTATATSDFDGDGSSDLREYTAETDAMDSSDFFRVQSQTLDASLTQATFEFNTNQSRRYRIETSTDLSTWTDSGLGVFAPDNGQSTIKVITFPSGSHRFFRAIVAKPLQP